MGQVEGDNMYKNEKGITLVELLAVLAIMSVVIALISSVHLFGQRQYRDQSETIEHQTEVRIVIAQLTRDIRNATIDTTTINENNLLFDTNNYTFNAPNLYRNGVLLSSKLNEFIVEVDQSETSKLNIHVSSIPDRNNKTHTVTTTIYLRE